MSNLTLNPAVMINRIAYRDGNPATPHLAKVAKLRMDLATAVNEAQAKAANLSPTGEAPKPVVDSGADVDRLI